MSDNAEAFVSGKFSRTALVFISGVKGVRPLQYVDIDGHARVEGCIDLGPTADVEALTEKLRSNASAVRQGQYDPRGIAIRELRYRWTDKTVPYTISPDLPDQQRVLDALEEWRKNSTLRFVSRTDEPNYVTFRPGSGCSSFVGMQGKQQFITLGANCTKGNCIHEIGHTLGLWHEQSRSDRDLYVRILAQNIQPGVEHNFFQHIQDGIDLGAYDYESIMHYPHDAFSKNGEPTIVPVGEQKIGQREYLSKGDIRAIAALYP